MISFNFLWAFRFLVVYIVIVFWHNLMEISSSRYITYLSLFSSNVCIAGFQRHYNKWLFSDTSSAPFTLEIGACLTNMLRFCPCMLSTPRGSNIVKSPNLLSPSWTCLVHSTSGILSTPFLAAKAYFSPPEWSIGLIPILDASTIARFLTYLSLRHKDVYFLPLVFFYN